MCNLSWTPHSNLEKDNSLNHSCVSPKMGVWSILSKNRWKNPILCGASISIPFDPFLPLVL